MLNTQNILLIIEALDTPSLLSKYIFIQIRAISHRLRNNLYTVRFKKNFNASILLLKNILRIIVILLYINHIFK